MTEETTEILEDILDDPRGWFRKFNELERRIEDLRNENKRLNSELAIKSQIKAVLIIDALLSRAGFDHWWGNLAQDLKEEVLESITQTLKE